MTILIAEDSPVDALILRNIVERDGHEVVMVTNGAEALMQLKERPDIALVLADIRMPDLDGVGLMRAMREQPEWADIPVIVISGADDEATVKEALSLRPAGYILKPLNEPSRILERIGRAART